MTDIAGIKAELDGLVREQADRRALREHQGEEIKARSHEYMTKQVQAAERYVMHRRELAQRKTKSGWSTDRTHAEPPSAFDDPVEFPSGGEARPARGESPRHARRHRAAEEVDEFENNPW
ncbi:hypothetical protein [Amycolatopsis sp. NPDC021455]|uniref:hypothetical protein n=1 Tax=Amycolatopsis sp. NPDC021455 TaxID=3154901 RepID=UPI0033F82666